jgi:hypothetical protein
MQSIDAHHLSRYRVILSLLLLAALAALMSGTAPAAEAAALAKPGAAIDATLSTAQPLRQAFNKDVAAAQIPLKPIGDASHDLTHAYYDNRLATAHSGDHMPSMSAAVDSMATPAPMGSMATPVAVDSMAMPAVKNAPPIANGSVVDESQPDGHEETAQATTPSESTKGLVLGGFGAVNGLVIAAAALLKARATLQTKAKAAARAKTMLGGATR